MLKGLCGAIFCCSSLYHFLQALGPVSRRSRKVWKAIVKIVNLMFTELFFSHNFNTYKVNFHAKFNANTLLSFSFEFEIIKNGFTGPIRY